MTAVFFEALLHIFMLAVSFGGGLYLTAHLTNTLAGRRKAYAALGGAALLCVGYAYIFALAWRYLP